ncbi:MAG: hydroxyacid dehydrogenase [Armatimonadota bacterium]|jgi:phosphoglycerate dehydrogenase-like enzyme
MADRKKVLYVCTAGHTERVFRPGKYEEMCELFDVTENNGESNWDSEEVAQRAEGMDAIVTGWGAPAMIPAVFEAASDLKIIAHSAGSVHGLIRDEIAEQYVVPREITVFSANGAIATNVAESAIGMLLMTMRQWVHFSNYIHETPHWRSTFYDRNGQFLLGSTVGVVSASKVGREVIRLLEPWHCEILVFDPYLSDQDAAQMGVERVELNELFERSDHVTVHAPKTPETEKMIGDEQLSLLRDGATLVNTSRGSVIDHDALFEHAKARRIHVCLDVTTPEPLEPASPFRQLDNVLITPHVSGSGYYGYHLIGDQTVQALLDCFAGRPVEGAVPMDRFETIA